jgi:hypothetical protein
MADLNEAVSRDECRVNRQAAKPRSECLYHFSRGSQRMNSRKILPPSTFYGV